MLQDKNDALLIINLAGYTIVPKTIQIEEDEHIKDFTHNKNKSCR